MIRAHFSCRESGICVWLEVQASLKMNSDKPTTKFALFNQYVREIRKAREAPEDQPPAEEVPREDGDVGEQEPPAKAWRYAAVRKAYLDKLKAGGVSHADAMEQWDDSEDKRLYLRDVPLPELKRRKFVPKGSTMNPWADE